MVSSLAHLWTWHEVLAWSVFSPRWHADMTFNLWIPTEETIFSHFLCWQTSCCPRYLICGRLKQNKPLQMKRGQPSTSYPHFTGFERLLLDLYPWYLSIKLLQFLHYPLKENTRRRLETFSHTNTRWCWQNQVWTPFPHVAPNRRCQTRSHLLEILCLA